MSVADLKIVGSNPLVVGQSFDQLDADPPFVSMCHHLFVSHLLKVLGFTFPLRLYQLQLNVHYGGVTSFFKCKTTTTSH